MKPSNPLSKTGKPTLPHSTPQEHPITILAQMVAPVETDLSDEELAAYAALHTYKPTTNINNDAVAWMEIGYQADTKLYIDKQFAELRNAIVSLGGNV